MRYSFHQIYNLDIDLKTAVVTYLDAEHYMFLHDKYENNYRIVEVTENKLVNRCDYSLFFLKWVQESTMIYNPPGEFVQERVHFYGHFAFVMNYLFNVKTTLRYTETDQPKQVRSDIRYDIDVPFFIYPFMFLIKPMLKKLKWEKDYEDIVMIERREALLGPKSVNAYFAPHQFILFKDLFAKHFKEADQNGQQAVS